jgi:hypothetical protein
VQSWLWAAPAKHSTRQIDRVLERIDLLISLKVDQHLAELPEAIVRRYARRLASRAPAVAARIAEPTRTIEVACFLRYSLMINTDHLLWMVRRRVADLWRKAAEEADAQRVNYERLYQQAARRTVRIGQRRHAVSSRVAAEVEHATGRPPGAPWTEQSADYS